MSPADVERSYNDNIEQYSTPEQIRASHILLKTEGKDEAGVLARANDLLKQARAGADFADLARKNSEDDGSASQGGDLDYFGRGRMVPEFEQAAFEAPSDTIVGPVKTQFGFHIIKLIDKKPATTRPLDQVRQQISDQLANDRAQSQVDTICVAIEKEITGPADLDRVAKARGLTVVETGFFTRDEPLMSLGPAPAVNARAFELKDGEMSGAIRVARGEVFFTLTGRQDAYLPKTGRGDVIVSARMCCATRRGARPPESRRDRRRLEACDGLREGRAKAANVELRSTELVARGSAIPGSAAHRVSTAAFALPEGGVSDPMTVPTGIAIVKVRRRSPP